MAGSSDIKAGKAYVEIGTKDSALQKGLANAQKRLKSWGSGISSLGTKMAVIGGAITAPLIAAAKSAADSGAAIYDMSRRTGISVEALSKLGYAAQLTSTDMGTVENAIKRMQKTISGTKDEIEGTTGSLDHLGITAADIKGKNPAEQFGMIAAQIAKIKDPTERANAAMKVFGKSGTDLIPMIEDYADLAKQAEKFGMVKTTASAKEQKEFANTLIVSQMALSGLWKTLGTAVIPILKKKTETIIQVIVAAKKWAATNKPLVASLFSVATGVAFVGAGLVLVAKAFPLIATGIGAVQKSISIGGSLIGLLLNPIGLVIIGLTALAAYFLYASGEGSKALGWLKDRFFELKEDATAAFKGISDAMAAGDLKLAGAILWSLLKLEWAKGIQFIKEKWLKFKTDAIIVFLDLSQGVQDAWAMMKEYLTTWDGVKTAISKVAAWIRHTFENVVNHVSDLLQSAFFDVSSKELSAALDDIDRKEKSGKLSKSDADQARKAAHDTFDSYDDKNKRTRDAAEQKRYEDRQAAIDADFKSKHPELVAEYEAAKARNKAAHDSAVAGAVAGRDADLAGLDADVAKKKKELEDAIAQAHKEAADAKRDTVAGGPGGSGLPDPNATLTDVAKRSGAAGTFNARAIQGLESNDVAHQHLAEAKKQSKYLKSLDDNFRANGPLQFGY